MKNPLLLLLALVALPVWALPEPPMTLEEACAKAELIVVGTLDVHTTVEKPSEVEAKACPWSGRIGRIAVKETLYGLSPKDGLNVWQGWLSPSDQPPPPNYVPTPSEGKAGQEWIWCLSKAPAGSVGALAHPGIWMVNHTQMVIATDLKAEVEKVVKSRVEVPFQLLRASRSFLTTMDGGPRKEKPSAEFEACDVLTAAGPCAYPFVKLLLAEKNPVARAWGCRAAGASGSPEFVGPLRALLEDKTKVTAGGGCKRADLPLGALAQQALEAIRRNPRPSVPGS